MNIRETRELIFEVLGVSLFLSLIVVLPDLFSSDSIETKLKLVMLTQLVVMLLSVPFVYSFRKSRKKSDEVNRAFHEQNERKAQAAESARVYEENYQHEGRALKQLVLEDLKALAQGKKVRLEPQTVEAVKALQRRQGDHPDTVAAWAPVIDGLEAIVLDPKALQSRLDELLYPETLENIDTLKKLVKSDLDRVTRGEKSRLDPETLEAAKALNEIATRDIRRKHEENEAEALEKRLEKEADKRFSAAMDEMAMNSARNILRMHGRPETELDGLSLDEVLLRIRALRLSYGSSDTKPIDER